MVDSAAAPRARPVPQLNHFRSPEVERWRGVRDRLRATPFRSPPRTHSRVVISVASHGRSSPCRRSRSQRSVNRQVLLVDRAITSIITRKKPIIADGPSTSGKYVVPCPFATSERSPIRPKIKKSPTKLSQMIEKTKTAWSGPTSPVIYVPRSPAPITPLKTGPEEFREVRLRLEILTHHVGMAPPCATMVPRRPKDQNFSGFKFVDRSEATSSGEIGLHKIYVRRPRRDVNQRRAAPRIAHGDFPLLKSVGTNGRKSRCTGPRTRVLV